MRLVISTEVVIRDGLVIPKYSQIWQLGETEEIREEIIMKKTAIFAAILPALALAACNNTPETETEAQADAMEEQADQMDEMADDATSEVAEENMEDKADAMEDKADALEDQADAEEPMPST